MRFFFVIFIFSSFCFSQTLDNAFDLSYYYNTLGSSRFNSLGGAMGSLGQDLSALNINPASGSISKNIYLGITVNNNLFNDNSSFYDKRNSVSNYQFNFSQVGFLISRRINEDGESNFKGFGIGINYNTLKDMRQNNTIYNARTNSSIIQSFVNNANYYDYKGIGEIDEVEGLAKDLNIIKFDPQRPSNNKFYTDIADFNNQKSINISKLGKIGEYSFSGSFNYNDVFFMGASYIHHSIVSFSKEISIIEKETNIDYKQNISTVGSGNGFSIGIIMKPTYFLRLGFAYKSSIKYFLTDIYTYKLNGLQDNDYEYIYGFNSPSSMTFSGAFIFGQIGLISFDYESKKYSDMNFFKEYANDFIDINEQIKSLGADSYNIRIGSEFRWLIFRLRSGYSFSSSPNKDFDNSNYRINFGLGLVVNKYDFDISYGYFTTKYRTFIYDKEFVNPILTRLNQNFITLSLNYYFDI